MKVSVTYKETGNTVSFDSVVKVYTKSITLAEQYKNIPALMYRSIVLLFADGDEIPLNPKYYDITIE